MMTNTLTWVQHKVRQTNKFWENAYEAYSVQGATNPNRKVFSFWQLLMAELLLHHVVRQAEGKATAERIINKAKVA